jgi:hypothetical protein
MTTGEIDIYIITFTNFSDCFGALKNRQANVDGITKKDAGIR